MNFIKFLFKKLNIHFILIAYLVYFILFLCNVNVKYGSLAFALTHIAVFVTVFYSVFRLIFPIQKTENTKSKKEHYRTRKSPQMSYIRRPCRDENDDRA